ncbi:family 10 glycosylhydrolase [Niabella sp.]|uniref:family 10 glycosylhydrolase n=1 Tax=Niabella sp. TaxID=1962976 RepID=UPI00261ADF9A|nr:family 10 glycosylhydrolase [Niabella sp.]
MYKKFLLLAAYTMLIFCEVTYASDGTGVTIGSMPDRDVSPIPQVPREFRAAWVATVANINWPSKPGLPVEQQQKEAIALLDFLQAHHFNAVIFQVRPQADALYKSALEPWSYFLTGTQGKAPEPFYDPLQFWIDAAHARGLELHVWLNPYRAHHVSGGPVTERSLVKTKPGLVVKLKEGYWWFDPSLKATQDHGVNVVMDIVKRYNIDGVHFDDYFYPYPSYNGNEDFPDSLSWAQYQKAGGKLSRGDWRRQSVNTFIHRLYTEIKKEKKHVKFGISPFGIWRPGYPESVTGFDQYEELYADAKLWLNKGWVDYFSPQLYWPIRRLEQSFPVLLGWWASENLQRRHVWPGISVGRDTSGANTTEVINEIMVDRGLQPQSSGVVHWSISSVAKNPGLANALVEGPYKKQALVPPSPWLDAVAPAAPRVSLTQKADAVTVQWSHVNDKDVFHWVVYYQYGTSWSYKILNQDDRSLLLNIQESGRALQRVAVSAVDRSGNESSVTETPLNKVVILPRSSWQAADAKPYKQHTPVRITVHHEGGKVLSENASATTRLKNIQTWCMGPDRKWTDIPYHYLIAPDGTVYEGRNPLTVGETNTEYDPTGHLLICFLGNYEEQTPTPHLKVVLSRLIAQLCEQYRLSPETISTHRDHSKITSCPGKNIYPWFENGSIKKQVKEWLKEPKNTAARG